MWQETQYRESDYRTKLFYPRRELDEMLVIEGREFFNSLKAELKLDVYFVITYPLPKGIKGKYHSLWRQYNFKNEKFGEITIDVEQHRDAEDLFDTIKHEICHAICDFQYDYKFPTESHDSDWIAVAKLMGVDTAQYEK
jgi:hypothetical protein